MCCWADPWACLPPFCDCAFRVFPVQDLLASRYGENYLHLLKRPSPARFVAEEWGGDRSAFPEPNQLSDHVEQKLNAMQRAHGEFDGAWDSTDASDASEASDSEDDGLLPGEEQLVPPRSSAMRSVSHWFASHFLRKAPQGQILV